MARIPDEVMATNVLPRLPLKIISQFKCVSKDWCNLFETPSFIKQHLKLAIENNNDAIMIDARIVSTGFYRVFSFEDIDSLMSNENSPLQVDPGFLYRGSLYLWGSCHGLVCIGRDIHSAAGILYIYNPSTTKCRKLPTPTITFAGRCVNYLLLSGYGFGYDSKVEDYKFVVLMTVPGGSGVGVYTLRTNSWKGLKNSTPFRLVSGRQGVLANEFTHWLAVPWSNVNTKHWVILSFDFSSETFHQVPPPKTVHAHYSELRIGGFEGSLCLIVNKDNVYIDIWVQKDSFFGVTDSWTKQFTISSQPHVDGSLSFVQPLKSFKNGEILMLQSDRSLALYDPKSKSLRTPLSGIKKVWGVELYVQSLVSVTEICTDSSEATTTWVALTRERATDTIKSRQVDAAIRLHY